MEPLYLIIISIIYTIPIFLILKNAIKGRKIRKSRIAIIIICLLNICIIHEDDLLLLMIMSTCVIPIILLFSSISMGIDEKQKREKNNMNLFGGGEE